jgi:hypothetical protein
MAAEGSSCQLSAAGWHGTARCWPHPPCTSQCTYLLYVGGTVALTEGWRTNDGSGMTGLVQRMDEQQSVSLQKVPESRHVALSFLICSRNCVGIMVDCTATSDFLLNKNIHT